MATFGSRLAELRNQRNLNQFEVARRAGLHPSDLSKIERDIRKPPKPEHLLPLFDVLDLSRKESQELLELGGYSHSLLSVPEFDPSSYPEITREHALSRLKGDRGFWPVWELDMKGVVLRANLLAFWLWSALTSEYEILADKLLGLCVFLIYIRPENFPRIAMPEKASDFWYTKLMVFKKLERVLPAEVVLSFEESILKHSVLSLIYQYGNLELDDEWSYRLKIQPPCLHDRSNQYQESLYFEFVVSVEQVVEEGEQFGYLVTFQPLKHTIAVVEDAYNRLLEKYERHAFVQDEEMQAMAEEDPYPAFIPTIYQDALWYITEENRAQQLLIGRSFVGQHFFDLVFSREAYDLAGPPADATLWQALWYFFKLTNPYQDETHPLHTQYEQMMKYLLEKPAFREAVEQFWQKTSPAKLAETPQDRKPACFHAMNCRYSSTFLLSFASIPRFLHNSKRAYRISVVPWDVTQDETKAALILMMIEDSVATEGDIGQTFVEQVMWGLAVVRTLRAGMGKGEGDSHWSIEDAFRRIRQGIGREFHHVSEPTVDELTQQLHIALLGLTMQYAAPTIEHILDMLVNFTRKVAEQLHPALVKELEAPADAPWEKIMPHQTTSGIKVDPEQAPDSQTPG